MSNPSDIRGQGGALVRGTLIGVTLLLAPPCAILLVLGLGDWAFAVAIGGVLGWLNITLLVRAVGGAIGSTLTSIDLSREQRGEPTLAELDAQLPRQDSEGEGDFDPRSTDPGLVRLPRGFGALTRMGLGIGALGALFWFQPREPGGIALGVVGALAALVITVLATKPDAAR